MKIILYVIDSLRADHLPCYGYKRSTAPYIQSLVHDSVIFEKAYCQSTWTRASAASILTGTYPSVHGVITMEDFMPFDIRTLPELLKEHGYQTIGISAMGNVSSTFGFNKGFDHFVDLYKDEELLQKRGRTSEYKFFKRYEKEHTIVDPLAEDITQKAIPFIEKYYDQKMFIFLWSIDVHNPFFPPIKKFSNYPYEGPIDGSNKSIRKAKRPKEIQRLIDLYDDEIYYNDQCIGEFINYLKKKGIYDESLIILTSDHGESFYEHGLKGHGQIPYEEQIHIPLIIKFPRSENRGHREGTIVQLIDLYPTIAKLAGVNNIPAYVCGTDLRKVIRTKERMERYAFVETRLKRSRALWRAVRTERWKYIVQSPPEWSRRFLFSNPFGALTFLKDFMKGKRQWLFNLEIDPEEKVNVIGKELKVADALQKIMQKWQDEILKLREEIGCRTAGEIDDQTAQHLRNLGYID